MSTIWYTSDLHLGHRLVAGLRGFGEDTAAHDKALANNWDKRVAPIDTIWVLGDISGGGLGSQRRALAWIKNRPGTKHLVVGNHDGVHPMHQRAHQLLPEYLEAFSTVQMAARRVINGQNIILSHFPYLGHPDERTHRPHLAQWMLTDCGNWLLHGHTHDTEQIQGRSIHIGLDAWQLNPVSGNTISDIVQSC